MHQKGKILTSYRFFALPLPFTGPYPTTKIFISVPRQITSARYCKAAAAAARWGGSSSSRRWVGLVVGIVVGNCDCCVSATKNFRTTICSQDQATLYLLLNDSLFRLAAELSRMAWWDETITDSSIFLFSISSSRARKQQQQQSGKVAAAAGLTVATAAMSQYVCDWGDCAVGCTMQSLAPITCQKDGCDIPVHHVCQINESDGSECDSE